MQSTYPICVQSTSQADNRQRVIVIAEVDPQTHAVRHTLTFTATLDPMRYVVDLRTVSVMGRIRTYQDVEGYLAAAASAADTGVEVSTLDTVCAVFGIHGTLRGEMRRAWNQWRRTHARA